MKDALAQKVGWLNRDVEPCPVVDNHRKRHSASQLIKLVTFLEELAENSDSSY